MNPNRFIAERLDLAARERIRPNAIAKASAFDKHGKVRLPGLAGRVAGTKPSEGQS